MKKKTLGRCGGEVGKRGKKNRKKGGATEVGGGFEWQETDQGRRKINYSHVHQTIHQALNSTYINYHSTSLFPAVLVPSIIISALW